ncbi:hypothetical protein TNCV_1938531 [Trichonephila clavipes]|nr:hypothetical protein TNCV_1938531 [Trichonephila clavipes]
MDFCKFSFQVIVGVWQAVQHGSFIADLDLPQGGKEGGVTFDMNNEHLSLSLSSPIFSFRRVKAFPFALPPSLTSFEGSVSAFLGWPAFLQLLFNPPVGGNRFLGGQGVLRGKSKVATPQLSDAQLPDARVDIVSTKKKPTTDGRYYVTAVVPLLFADGKIAVMDTSYPFHHYKLNDDDTLWFKSMCGLPNLSESSTYSSSSLFEALYPFVDLGSQ